MSFSNIRNDILILKIYFLYLNMIFLYEKYVPFFFNIRKSFSNVKNSFLIFKIIFDIRNSFPYIEKSF